MCALPIPASVAAISLLSGLSEQDLERLLRICRPVSFAAGERIVRQGQPADGAFLLESGTAEAVTALPGGGHTVVGTLAAGAVIGETALLERGVRSATVVASSPIRSLFIDRDAFRLALVQREPAAFVVRGRITRALCDRLRVLNERVIAANQATGGSSGCWATAIAAKPSTRRPCTFDWRAFVPLLEASRAFGADERERFCALVAAFELARGDLLFEQGDPADFAYVVVRGALQLDLGANGQRHRIGILGPGRLCGVVALIEGRVHSMRALAREHVTLLELGRAAFDRLANGHDLLAMKFQDAVNAELLRALARTNNQLTRLVSQARIQGSARTALPVQQIERELAVVDLRTG